ncbi:MAG: hypothetical protein LBM06_00745 [Prevotellaceae bacterium]|jgi:hypothetical protein|nr:hypothetical protein [Prevotellaceae bacterium]
MKQKSPYQAPSIDLLKMDHEGVIAASTQDFGAGKRYHLAQDTPPSPTRGLFRFAKNLLPLVAAALMLPACSSEEEPQPTPDGGKTRITVTAGIDEVTTRTTYTPGVNDEDTADQMSVVWSSGETLQALSFLSDYSLKPSTLTGNNAGAGTKNMEFTGDVAGNTGGSWADKHHYYYGPTPTFVLGSEDNPPRIGFILRGQEYDVTQTVPISSLKNYDVMYTTSPTAGGNISLQHACALIRFNLRLNTAGKSIRQITMSADYADFLIRSSVWLKYRSDGTITKIVSRASAAETVLTLTIKNDTGTSEDRDLVAYLMLPIDPEGLDISGRLIKVSAIDEDGKVYSRILNLTDKAAGTEVLQAGNCYTFFDNTPTPLKEDNFAGSNIYWDGTQLTFVKEPYDMSAVMNQGLYFKWGGLDGISPVGTWDDTAVTGTAWYNYASGKHNGGAWDNLLPATWTAGQNLADAQDICYQLSGGTYRMPERYEIPTSGAVSINSSATFTANTKGTAQIMRGYIRNGNLYFPRAGYRGNSAGGLNNGSFYWTKTVGNSDKGVSLFNNNYQAGSDINTAMPIRCIKNP